MIQKIGKALVAIVALTAGAAQAAVINIEFGFDTIGVPSGRASGSLTIESEFASTVYNSTDGLTVNSLNFDPGIVQYSYFSAEDRLHVGAGIVAVPTDQRPIDFTLFIDNFLSAPTLRSVIFLTRPPATFRNTKTLRQSISSDYLSVSQVPTVVPIPAAAWLFGSGLIGLLGIARRKKSA